ncbi:MAG: undecaprenyl-diphosphate phosphatase [Candidatus Liberibacter ctenarytainae]|uniref:Undecaprenyl-diphosphatase n=1 Tax=Candidatus Liberibacter ctenarytainae TaxID=2020335 RepID=A0A937AQ45_9HYPH|nr:undecaprenyl-diphosphate phosphatase [Candidatus Liberibacter ctenarytainae]
MTEDSIFWVIILGIVEGITEFIPVSSTAHLLLISHFMDIKSPGNSFIVLVQLGAVAALLHFYFYRIMSIFSSLPFDASTRYFVISLFLGFFPSAVFGFFARDFIQSILFKETTIMFVMLIIGGFVLLGVDSVNFRPKYFDVQKYPLSLAVKIGLFQCFALVPGTSRSGSTIVGALVLGADKRSATEFSFFLAIPTIIGACALDFYKNHAVIVNDIGFSIIIGCCSSFVTGLIVIRYLLNFVSKRGYAVFALWRILVGSIGLFWDVFS